MTKEGASNGECVVAGVRECERRGCPPLHPDQGLASLDPLFGKAAVVALVARVLYLTTVMARVRRATQTRSCRLRAAISTQALLGGPAKPGHDGKVSYIPQPSWPALGGPPRHGRGARDRDITSTHDWVARPSRAMTEGERYDGRASAQTKGLSAPPPRPGTCPWTRFFRGLF